MKLSTTVEHKFRRTPDGSVWSLSQFPYDHWSKYLRVFDHVQVIARVLDVPESAPTWQRADGEGVSFTAVPYYVGPIQYARKFRQIRRSILNEIREDRAALLQVSSPIGTVAYNALRRRSQPFGAIVVSDPATAFLPGAVDHPLRAFFRWKFSRDVRRVCASAAAISYVTKDYLQKIYPPAEDSAATYFSNVLLPEEAFVKTAHRLPAGRRLRVVTVVTLEQRYKGVDDLIDAAALCRERGVDLEIVVVGDGIYRQELEQQANALPLLKDRVIFRGQLSSAAEVRAELDQADLFVLASRTEGLPRAVIEAMARGLPCIGTTVGGIPELLRPSDMVPPNEPSELAELMGSMLSHPERANEAAEYCLREAAHYHLETMRARQDEFLAQLAERTAEWQKRRGIMVPAAHREDPASAKSRPGRSDHLKFDPLSPRPERLQL